MVDLAHALGASFGPCFQAIFPTLMKYARPTVHHSLRAAAIGAMAEATKGADTPPTPEMTVQLFQLGLTGLTNRTANPDIQRTSAFLCGVLLELGKDLLESYVLNTLQGLHPLFGSPDPTVVDNACGAVSRIITTFPNSPHVPLEHVLPILLAALPIRQDHQEDEPVWKCVVTLCRLSKVTAVAETVVQLVGAIARGLEQVPSLSPAIVEELRITVRAWLPQLQAMSGSVEALPALLQAISNKLFVSYLCSFYNRFIII
jgi:importin-4